MQRRISREVKIGTLRIGGKQPIRVQSMLNVLPDDIAGNVQQAVQLQQAGCEIIRLAIPNTAAVPLIPAIKREVSVPLVADIHFDYRLALDCAAAGIDKIRINPGNIGGQDRVQQVAAACRAKGIPIRIGVNAGSLEQDLLASYGGPTAEALVESALRHAAMLEACDFYDIVLSLKASNVPRMVEAYTLAAHRCDYPLHLGVTEAGTLQNGLIKSGVGIGALLFAGIGDTIRVSLTADPVEEVKAGHAILKATGLRRGGPEVIACPTCGRTKIDIIRLANEVEQRLAGCQKEIQVAVMGCAVNGPGEAKEADIGIAGGDGVGLLFRKGEVVRKVPEAQIVDVLLEEIERL